MLRFGSLRDSVHCTNISDMQYEPATLSTFIWSFRFKLSVRQEPFEKYTFFAQLGRDVQEIGVGYPALFLSYWVKNSL